MQRQSSRRSASPSVLFPRVSSSQSTFHITLRSDFPPHSSAKLVAQHRQSGSPPVGRSPSSASTSTLSKKAPPPPPAPFGSGKAAAAVSSPSTYEAPPPPYTAPSIASSAASVAATKRAPPPPPPLKPKPKSVNYVVALYDFAAQADGDLDFKVGDRIEVVERTDSAEDWWTGRLDGRTGVFPGEHQLLPASSWTFVNQHVSDNSSLHR